MYTIKRAIIMAAGTGTRMQPVTLYTPKPLVRVNGVRMIDTIIRALNSNGIDEIYIVVGYLEDQFASLGQEYPGVQLIRNPWYDTCNNISSLYVAREKLSNVIILDGDQIIHDPEVLTPEFECSGYSCVWTDVPTKEWLLTVENGLITRCSRDGGTNGWQLIGISRWTEEDGEKLRQHLEIEFEKKRNRQIYWDDVALFCYPERYSLGICPIKEGTVQEIDSLQELAMIAPEYVPYLKGENL